MKNLVFIYDNDFQTARERIRKSEGRIVFSSESDELNRKILEKEEINILLINVSERKDWQKQRNSGFNHVLARIAKKNSVSIGINFDEIIKAGNFKDKSEIISRIEQNIRLCNKNKLQMIFISPSGISRDCYDLKALGLVLGMPTWMVRACILK